MGKYNFAVTRQNKIKRYQETFEVTGCDSFDEARKFVEKAVYERELIEGEELKKFVPPIPAQKTAPAGTNLGQIGASTTAPNAQGNPTGQDIS